MAGQFFSDSEIDEILGAVEETMQNAANLAKGGFPPQEGDEEVGDAPALPTDEGQADMGQEAPAEVPSEDMGAGAPGEEAPIGEEVPGEEAGMGDEMGAPEEEAGMPPEAGAEGDEALEGDDGELNDEELHQIYSSMDPSDLERHYMIIRSMLRDAYAKMEKTEDSSEDQQNSNEEEDMAKTEELEKKVSELTKSNDEMQKSLEAAVKAMQIIAKPERKAVTSEVQVLGKTESDVANGTNEGSVDYTSLSKSDITEKLNDKVRDPSLSKSDRDAINGYLLRGEGQDQVIKILGSK